MSKTAYDHRLYYFISTTQRRRDVVDRMGVAVPYDPRLPNAHEVATLKVQSFTGENAISFAKIPFFSRGVSAVLYVLLLLGYVAAQAQTLNTVAAHLKVNFIDLTWRVNADSTAVYEQAVEREALSQQGAQAATKFVQMYNKTLQRYEVIEAYTLKADGRKIPVEKEGMQIQSGIASGGTAASWPDAEIMQITFPDVQKGDRTGWRTRTTTLTPQLPGWASLEEHLIPSLQVDRFSATLEAPQGLNLQVVAVGMRMTTTQRQQHQVWHISGENKAVVMDSNAANLLVSTPRLIASTFNDHTQLAAAFARQLNAKAIVTDEVTKLVLNITGGMSTKLEKATAIHNWVRNNIRYVAVYLGAGGWVPHDVNWILKNGYGDCKDHALLLQTLLKAVDIEAVPVLISTANAYVLPELPVGFNHCIVYLPGFNLFADPTDSRIPLGALPWADSDKPVVVALNEGAKIMRTPIFTPANSRVTVKTQLDIAKNGKATGFILLDAVGMPATTLQDRLAQIPAEMGGVAVQNILEASNLRGRGTAQYTAIQRDAQVQTLKIVDLEIDNLLNDPLAGTINPHPALNLPMYILRNTGNYTAAKRDYAFTCSPIFIREEFELRFDPAFELLRIPSDFKESNLDGIAFEAHYTREGLSVKGWREMTLSHKRHVCSPAEFEARRTAMNQITKHLRSGILFQQ